MPSNGKRAPTDAVTRILTTGTRLYFAALSISAHS